MLLLALLARPAFADLNVLACEPEWAALVRELGGDKVKVSAATTAFQDPHRIEARPSLIARARSADLIVCTGAQLEIGWLPLLQRQSGNAKIQVGEPGYFEASLQVPLIEAPSVVDRSMGDVHPAGNPHIHLDPRNIAKVAVPLGARMEQLDPGNGAYYRSRTKSFLDRWQQATGRWEKAGAPLKGLPLVVYHKDQAYLFRWLGLREVGTLEPKPGLPPTTAHMSELLGRLAKASPKAVLCAAYNDPRPAQFIAERASVPVVVLPYTVGGSDQAKDLFGLYDDTLRRLLAVVQ